MDRADPEENRIILDLKDVFGGQTKKTSLKKVRNRLKNLQHVPKVKTLVAEYGLENICRVVFDMLKRDAFQPSAGDIPTTTTPLQATKGASSPGTVRDTDMEGSESLENQTLKFRSDALETTENVGKCGQLLTARDSASTLFPIYLPFEAQHRLLVALQQILEEALYSFGSEEIQKIVQRKGWNCAQCVELNDWMKILRKNKAVLNGENIQRVGKPVQSLLDSVTQIRHTAVHRQHVTIEKIDLFLADAECFAGLLDDQKRSNTIAEMRQQVSRVVDSLRQHRKGIETRLLDVAKETAAEKRRLLLKEHLTASQALKEDDEHQRLAVIQLHHIFLDLRPIRSGSGSYAIEDNESEECTNHPGRTILRFCSDCIGEFKADVEQEDRWAISVDVLSIRRLVLSLIGFVAALGIILMVVRSSNSSVV